MSVNHFRLRVVANAYSIPCVNFVIWVEMGLLVECWIYQACTYSLLLKMN